MRKNLFVICSAAVSLATMAACSPDASKKEAAAPAPAPVVKDIASLQGEWNVANVEKESFLNLADVKPFIGFDTKEGRIYGKSACNNIMGGYTFDPQKGSLTFSQIASTMMMCPEDNMNKEQLMIKALEKVRSFNVEGESAYLLDQDNKVVIEMVKKPAEEVAAPAEQAAPEAPAEGQDAPVATPDAK